MLKVGDKVKWSPKAIRSIDPSGKKDLRKMILTVTTVHPDFDHKVLVTGKAYGDKQIGWYKQNYFVKV